MEIKIKCAARIVAALARLSVCGITAFILSSAGGQTVQNGDFESPVIGSPFISFDPVPGWSRSGSPADGNLGAVGYKDSDGTITTAGHGRQFLLLGATARWSTQITGLISGLTYSVTFMMASESTFSQSLTASVTSGDSPSSQVTSVATFSAAPSPSDYYKSWENKVLAFVATSSTATLSFSVTNLKFDVGIDFVNVVPGTVSQGPFASPLSPNGPGPEGDPTAANCTSCGQPFTVSNGNMYHQFTDLTVTGRGFPLVLNRTYNSPGGCRRDIRKRLDSQLSAMVKAERHISHLLQPDGRRLYFHGAGEWPCATAWRVHDPVASAGSVSVADAARRFNEL
jgi:hypothetical protein